MNEQTPGEALSKLNAKPENAKAVEQAKQKLRDFAVAMQSQEYQDHLAKLNAEWEAKFREPAPQTLEELQGAIVRIGLEPQYALTGEWNEASILPMLEGYLQRLRDNAMQAPPQDNEGEAIGRMLAIMDDNAARIVTIADHPNLTADDKLRAMTQVDKRFYGKTAEQLGEILKVTSAAIKKTAWWKVDRASYRDEDEAERRNRRSG